MYQYKVDVDMLNAANRCSAYPHQPYVDTLYVLPPHWLFSQGLVFHCIFSIRSIPAQCTIIYCGYGKIEFSGLSMTACKFLMKYRAKSRNPPKFDCTPSLLRSVSWLLCFLCLCFFLVGCWFINLNCSGICRKSSQLILFLLLILLYW